jgi:hypothetical protein
VGANGKTCRFQGIGLTAENAEQMASFKALMAVEQESRGARFWDWIPEYANGLAVEGTVTLHAKRLAQLLGEVSVRADKKRVAAARWRADDEGEDGAEAGRGPESGAGAGSGDDVSRARRSKHRRR